MSIFTRLIGYLYLSARFGNSVFAGFDALLTFLEIHDDVNDAIPSAYNFQAAALLAPAADRISPHPRFTRIDNCRQQNRIRRLLLSRTGRFASRLRSEICRTRRESACTQDNEHKNPVTLFHDAHE